MKIKRVKDQKLGANQKHVMLSGSSDKTICVTSMEFYKNIRGKKNNNHPYGYLDGVVMAICKTAGYSIVVPLASKCVGGCSCPLFLASDESLVLIGYNDIDETANDINYMLTYKEIDNA